MKLKTIFIAIGFERVSVSSSSDFYFAYGSNMNACRVQERQMSFEEALAGILEGYRLEFNKLSIKYPGAGAANVVPDRGEKTEGVIYRLTEPGQIEMMDPFEGYPQHYRREVLSIDTKLGKVSAWVYIANPAYVAEGLRPARWYLDHLLAGGKYLSGAYFDALSQIACLPDSDYEPVL